MIFRSATNVLHSYLNVNVYTHTHTHTHTHTYIRVATARLVSRIRLTLVTGVARKSGL